MSSITKAGVPKLIKVNTRGDKFGIEAGFTLSYLNDKTKELTVIDDSFFEISEDVDDVSTTLSGDHSAGSTQINVADASGFVVNKVAKINGAYYRIVAIDADNNVITLKRGLDGAGADGDDVVLSGRTGTYGVEVTFPAAADYTVTINNFQAGMDNEAFALSVSDATIDDVKVLLDVVKTETDSIKEQVDTLDEEELNNIAETVAHLQETVENVRDLVTDVTATVTVNGDQTDNLDKEDIVSGTDSGALGNILSSSYDSDADVTTIVLDNVKGAFDADNNEMLHNNTKDVDIEAVQSVNYGASAVDSVLEFVKELNKELSDGATGLDAITTIGRDIKHLINGDDKLEDDSDCPTAGKGIVALFDELVAAHDDITAIKDLAEDDSYGFQALSTSVSDARSSIESKIAAMNDEDDDNSLISKVNAVKAVVDANEALLEDDTYGLSKIKDKLNDLAALFEDGGDIEVRFDKIDDAISDLNSDIETLSGHMDDRFDEVLDKINTFSKQTTYQTFA